MQAVCVCPSGNASTACPAGAVARPAGPFADDAASSDTSPCATDARTDGIPASCSARQWRRFISYVRLFGLFELTHISRLEDLQALPATASGAPMDFGQDRYERQRNPTHRPDVPSSSHGAGPGPRTQSLGQSSRPFIPPRASGSISKPYNMSASTPAHADRRFIPQTPTPMPQHAPGSRAGTSSAHLPLGALSSNNPSSASTSMVNGNPHRASFWSGGR